MKRNAETDRPVLRETAAEVPGARFSGGRPPREADGPEQGTARRKDGKGTLGLRPYEDRDAAAIVSWIGDERTFRKWSADRFESWPITAEDLKRHYAAADPDRFFPMTAFDDAGPAGHLIMRFTDEAKKVLRFGFVIVDGKRRGMGLGREMLALAARYAFESLKAEKITLGVFENNEPARRCYRAAGFRDGDPAKAGVYRVMGEEWKCLEMELVRPEAEDGQGKGPGAAEGGKP